MLVGRCIPLIRSLVSIPAGFRRMPFAMFTLYTAIGSAIWNSALIGAGYVLRDNWEDVEPVLDVVQYIVIARSSSPSAGSSGPAAAAPRAR